MKTNLNNSAIKFEKVSFEQFCKDIRETTRNLDKCKQIYEAIELPARATAGSAGYDIKTPIPLEIKPHETGKFPTGLRCTMNPNTVLMIFIRSSLGIKKGITLSNGTGIIDSDYAMADNEGHIWVGLTNNSDETFRCNTGDRICQGIFVKYGVTADDEASGQRTGGMGSTGE